MHVVFPKVLDALKTKVSDFNYKNWFQNLSWESDTDGKVTLRVPSKFVRDWIQTHYLELIKFELFRHAGRELDITFRVDKKTTPNLELFSDNAVPAGVSAAPAPAKAAPARRPQSLSDGFNPEYSFANFVVGQSNQLVHAACQAVTHSPGKSYNPLFIYGGVGLGKTHLLNAIGLAVRAQHPGWRIVSVTGEHFTNEVINAIRYNKTFEFRKKYREQCDLLLIDDIQFIAGKERTMEEFFHTFNTLYEGRKQIILTSDKMPRDIAGLEERLSSRFSWGLLADIQAPDYETRLAILQKKAEQDGFELPGDVADYIAKNVKTHVRDLEGALIRVFAFASLAKVQVSLGLAEEVLQNLIVRPQVKHGVESIQTRVAEYFHLKIADLKSKRRHKNLAVPRQIAKYQCKTYLTASFPEIGHKFGGKDHTTVMHAVSKIKKCLDGLDPQIVTDVKALEKILGL